ncbi:melanocortin receptor 4-like [Actinia tenebrosa]|uniref:Melanocortin receptor 4-like n=1 Tax=Actinia tenebrosa TaxID=6105 RepID=A0A6P8HJW2_ACTTE|nr:melanocortin receptor 4-like [Actinia tenebrosa]
MNIFETCVAYAAYIVQLTSSVRYLFILNVVMNGILALTATLGNGLILVAILRSQNLQTPSYLLITSLSFADLLVGLVYHPLQIVLNVFFLQNNVHGVCKIFKTFNFISILLGLLSFIMAACISIDRYLALRLMHRYRVVVTKKKVGFMILLAWSLGIGLASYSTQTNLFLCYGTVIFSILVVFLLLTCFFYFKAMRALQLYSLQVHAQHPPNYGFDVLKYKKLLKTMFLIFGCLLFCFLPILCSHIARLNLDLSRETILVYFAAHVTLALNSSVNPVIYLIGFKEIRQACKKLILNY